MISPVKGRLNFEEADNDNLLDINHSPRPRSTDINQLNLGIASMEVGNDSGISFQSSPEPGDIGRSRTPISPTPMPQNHTPWGKAPSKNVSGRRRGRNTGSADIIKTPAKKGSYRPRVSQEARKGFSPVPPESRVFRTPGISSRAAESPADFMGFCLVSPKKTEPDSLKRTHSEIKTPNPRNSPRMVPDSSKRKFMRSDTEANVDESPSVSPIPSEASDRNKFDTEFITLEHLASGSFGDVYKVQKKFDKAIYCIKVIPTGRLGKEARNEVGALSQLPSHENVLRYYDSWDSEDSLFIRTEYCDLGSLSKRIAESVSSRTPFDQNEIRRVTKQCATGLMCLHNLQLAHLDVKPDNIFVCRRERRSIGLADDDEKGEFVYKIGDFGHVRSFEHGPIRDFMDGDKYYLAPEVLHMMEDVLYDAPKADVFSLGISIFEVAGASRLPAERDFAAARRNGMVPVVPGLQLELNQLIQKMTSATPQQRPTMEQVLRDPCLKIVKPAHSPKASSSQPQIGLVKPVIRLYGKAKNLKCSSNVV